MSWWSVPCAADFVDLIVSDLRRGSSVVVCLPDPHPPGLPEAIKGRLSGEGLFVEEIEVGGGGDPPMRLLGSRCLNRTDLAEDDPVERILKEPGFRGRFIFLMGISAGIWPLWSVFLSRYEEACRPMNVVDRTVLCLFLSGSPSLSPPKPEVCLSVQCWRGYVHEVDMLYYCWSRVRNRGLPDLQRKLAAALATKIALWDPLVADFLLCRDLEELMNPVQPLAEYAAIRGWHAGPVASNPLHAWAEGKTDLFEGRWRTHPALLLGGNESPELRSRVWSAQISVLMPILEEERRVLIQQYRRQIPLPYKTPWGLVECVEDLELHHLGRILHGLRRVDFSLRQRAQHLTRIRNKLAHLEPLEISDLDSCL